MTMEDDHFYREDPHSILAGVFDRHHGKTAATHAKDRIPVLFYELLSTFNRNVIQTFEVLCQSVHDLYRGDHGTTALICYYHKVTRKVYTATLGDTEANIYRQIDGKVLSIPLSPFEIGVQIKNLSLKGFLFQVASKNLA